MATTPIIMKRGGSGSLAQKLMTINPPPGPTVYGSAYKGLTTTSGDVNPETIKAGIVIFLVVRRGNISEGIWANDVNGTQEFGAWCEEHGIVGEEHQALEAAISGVSGTYFTACVPVFAPRCVLCTGPGGKLLVHGNSLLCRVGHEWRIERPPPDLPPTVAVEAVSGEIRAYYYAAGMLVPDVPSQYGTNPRFLLEGPEGLVDLPDDVFGVYIPWSENWGPTIHDVELRGFYLGQLVDLRTADAFIIHLNGNSSSLGAYYCLGDVSRVLDYYAFSCDYPSASHYAPNAPGGEIVDAGSYEAAIAFLGSIVTAFPADAVFPNPEKVGKMWRAGTYLKEGRLVAINSSARPWLIGGDSEYCPSWIKIGDCPAGVDNPHRGGYDFRIDNVAPTLNNGDPLQGSVFGQSSTIPYKVTLDEQGTLINVSLRVTAFTGYSQSTTSRLPGDSYIIIGVVDGTAGFNTPYADPPVNGTVRRSGKSAPGRRPQPSRLPTIASMPGTSLRRTRTDAFCRGKRKPSPSTATRTPPIKAYSGAVRASTSPPPGTASRN